eukprot:GHVR01124940.1.p2 GENE.GHVR01124940.1~~GHVR01124940.1.p2  ORF type:complete len:390 (+),score=56.16 GHVR01124940.1:1545-2714(+)
MDNRVHVPVLKTPQEFDSWRKEFEWCMEAKLVEEKNARVKKLKYVAALIQAAEKVSVMKEIVLNEAVDLANPPEAVKILGKLEAHFKPHVLQQKSQARRKFYMFDHTQIKSSSYRDLLQSYDMLIETCKRSAYNPSLEVQYEVLAACIKEEQRAAILCTLQQQDYASLREKLNALMTVEVVHTKKETAEESTAYSNKQFKKKQQKQQIPVGDKKHKGPKYNNKSTSSSHTTPPQQNKNTTNQNNQICWWCGEKRHKREHCPANGKKCECCGKIGHLTHVCRKNKEKAFAASTDTVDMSWYNPESIYNIEEVNSVLDTNKEKHLELLLDSGCTKTLIPPHFTKYIKKKWDHNTQWRLANNQLMQTYEDGWIELPVKDTNGQSTKLWLKGY